MPANYYSIAHEFKHEIEIKKSRFLTYLIPIESEQDAVDHLAKIKKEHYKANHHCSAYILYADASVQRMSDDGEPSGTAGVPMLEVLKRQALTNILAVVVRYFGGTKLGAGGLIRAYSGAVSEAIAKAPLIQNISQQMIQLTLVYGQVDSFQYLLQTTTLPVTVVDTIYTDVVEFMLAINIEAVDVFYQQLVEQFSGQIKWQDKGIETVNIPFLPNQE